MKEIAITKGYTAIIDDEDYAYLSQWKWQYHKGYAVRTKKGRHIYMHRVINDTPDGKQTDHINTCKLDNRRANLRTVSRGENNTNRPSERGSSSKWKGVSWNKTRKIWEVQLKPVGAPKMRIGYFRSESDAATAYNLAAAIYSNSETRFNVGG